MFVGVRLAVMETVPVIVLEVVLVIVDDGELVCELEDVPVPVVELVAVAVHVTVLVVVKDGVLLRVLDCVEVVLYVAEDVDVALSELL